jgi:hypothetical protein
VRELLLLRSDLDVVPGNFDELLPGRFTHPCSDQLAFQFLELLCENTKRDEHSRDWSVWILVSLDDTLTDVL